MYKVQYILTFDVIADSKQRAENSVTFFMKQINRLNTNSPDAGIFFSDSEIYSTTNDADLFEDNCKICQQVQSHCECE